MKLKVKNYLFALCGAITLLFDWKNIYFNGLKALLDYRLIIVLMLSFIIFFVYNKFDDEKTKYSKIMSLIFCLSILIGNSYNCFGTIE